MAKGSLIGSKTQEILREVIREHKTRPKSTRLPRRGNAPVNHALPVFGVTTEAIDKGDTGTVSIVVGAPPDDSEDSGETLEAYNGFADVATGKQVMCVHNGFAWFLVAAECE
jgi:hypothetical protein